MSGCVLLLVPLCRVTLGTARAGDVRNSQGDIRLG
jgi:hypothetical protein